MTTNEAYIYTCNEIIQTETTIIHYYFFFNIHYKCVGLQTTTQCLMLIVQQDPDKLIHFIGFDLEVSTILFYFLTPPKISTIKTKYLVLSLSFSLILDSPNSQNSNHGCPCEPLAKITPQINLALVQIAPN